MRMKTTALVAAFLACGVALAAPAAGDSPEEQQLPAVVAAHSEAATNHGSTLSPSVTSSAALALERISYWMRKRTNVSATR